MPKFKKSQILFLSLLIALLTFTPLLSPNQRTPYLYFIMNLLIIALGAEAGLLSFFLKPSQEDKMNETGHNNTNASSKEAITTSPINSTHDMEITNSNSNNNVNNNMSKDSSITSKIVLEKCASEKIVSPLEVNRIKKCPSAPSIFSIGGGETPGQDVADQVFEESEREVEAEEEVEGISGQELFAKAENFIGNFYKQLKMQREESWKKIHGLYHKAL